VQLGVNFSPAPEQASGFNVDAVRALRPPLVRLMLDNPATTLETWIASARRHKLHVLWSIPLELVGLQAAVYAARFLALAAADVTWGVEIGYAPWFMPAAADAFLADAIVVASEARQAFPRPCILLGLGYDGSPKASAFLGRLLAVSSGSSLVAQAFGGVTASIIAPGRRPRRYVLRGAALKVGSAWRLPLVVTRAGWPLGMRLRPFDAVRELLTGDYSPMGDTRAFGVLTPRMRRTWTLEAYELARALGSPCFVLEHEPRRTAGLHTWSLFDPIESRPDPLWIAVQWHHARLERAIG
jgi:hypothetical protein